MTKPFRLTAPVVPESVIQDAILKYLALDYRVAWAERFNTGAHVIDDSAAAKGRLFDRYAPQLYASRNQPAALLGVIKRLLSEYWVLRNAQKNRRFIQYAFKGCADILGQTIDGRFLAIEVKTEIGRATPEQRDFLANVNESGGVGILARSVGDVQLGLNATAIGRSAKTAPQTAFA